MPATVPIPAPTPLPPATTGWAFLVGRRTREQKQCVVAFPDAMIVFVGSVV